MKESAKASPKPAVLSLAQLLAEQPASPPPGWIDPGLLPPAGILFVGGEPKVGKSLLVANLALALAAGKDRAGFTIPAARRVLVCQFELPTPQFVGRLAMMRRSLGAAADQNLLVDTRAGGNLLSAPQGLNHFLNAARQAVAEVIVLDPLYSTHDQDGRGRDSSRPPPPAQTRAGAASAHGSYLEYLASNRLSGNGCRIRTSGIWTTRS